MLLNVCHRLADYLNKAKVIYDGCLQDFFLVLGLFLCLHDNMPVAGTVRVAACLCAASWHQKRPWMESTEAQRSKGKREGPEINRRQLKRTSLWKKASQRSLLPMTSLPFLLH